MTSRPGGVRVIPRLRKSSVVLAVLVTTFLVLVNLPGRVANDQTALGTTFEHGWPFIYLRRAVNEPVTVVQGVTLSPAWVERRDVPSHLPMWGIPWLSMANWRIWQPANNSTQARRDFRPGVVLLNVAIASLVLLAAVVTWEFRRRRRPSLFCFGLGELLVVIALFSAGLGWLAYQEREYQREASLIQREANRTAEDPVGDTWFGGDQMCVAPTWIRSLIGERFLPAFMWRTASVQIHRQWRNESRPAIYKEISQLDYVTRVVLENSDVRHPFHLSALKILPQLETLEFWNNPIFDERDIHELKQLARLRRIIIENKEEIVPEMLSMLATELPNCQVVDFDEAW